MSAIDQEHKDDGDGCMSLWDRTRSVLNKRSCPIARSRYKKI